MFWLMELVTLKQAQRREGGRGEETQWVSEVWRGRPPAGAGPRTDPPGEVGVP